MHQECRNIEIPHFSLAEPQQNHLRRRSYAAPIKDCQDLNDLQGMTSANSGRWGRGSSGESAFWLGSLHSLPVLYKENCRNLSSDRSQTTYYTVGHGRAHSKYLAGHRTGNLPMPTEGWVSSLRHYDHSTRRSQGN